MRAVFSACGRYRHQLTEPGAHPVAWVMLNPSRAGSVDEDSGEVRSDPTNNKIRAFTKSWGYSGHVIGNVYDLVSTDPAGLWKSDAPCSPANDAYLQALATMPLIVVAWGRHAKRDAVLRAVRQLTAFGGELWSLGVNGDGSPPHPLYLPYDRKLQRWTVDGVVSSAV